MKVYAIIKYTDTNGTNGTETYIENLGSVNFFFRRNIREIIKFAADELRNEVTTIGVQRVQHDTVYCYCYRSSAQQISFVFTDAEIETKLGSCLVRAVDQYTNEDQMHQLIANPEKADKIASIQQELDETKAIAIRTMEQLLEREGKLNDLMDKTNKLSADTRKYMENAKRLNNRCCVIL